MSNILGIIAEYNPFHNGHLHHLLEAKKITNSDYVIVVMSGNFTQRGEPSITDKWSKAKMAIDSGVDLVLELPTIYSISSAENFASGAVKILDSLKIVNFLAFGSECNNISVLDDIANVLVSEPQEYKTLLAHELSSGTSYPKARENALMMYLNDIRRFANVISSPNNILGIEYLKALKRQKSRIQPISIKRIGSNYNDDKIPINSNFASATAIRNLCQNHDTEMIQKFMPESSYKILKDSLENGHIVKGLSDFDKVIIYTLRKMSTDDIANLPDVSEGLEFAIKSASMQCNTVSELLSIVNTKRYTQTRLQRILLYAILGITKKDILTFVNTKPYIRILGFNDNGKKLLSEISKNNPKLELVSSVKKFMDKSSNKNLKLMMEKDIWATNVYTLGFEYDSIANWDYTHKLVD